ncbi:EAL domain-containing protein [Neobittarella massiliensis]|uniref:EAL domain-containing protein n=1 Tax=Neobittarella massiliensis (ex Bilen et al. 2018) TaxID=2041842 RepID=A0A8J6LYV2_9FIRM|nr:EAL domain-containing protein [Neobittarella massiliensis]MBC3515958.1 EAL domain-containing protein [Neobittarella massiliensis]
MTQSVTRQKAPRRITVMRKMLLPIILVMVVQAVIFYSVILLGGTLTQLDQNSFDILNERVINRKNYLQNDMIQRWSNLRSSPDTITASVKQALGGRSADELMGDLDLSTDVLRTLSPELLYLLRLNAVTGAFVVLGQPTTAQLEAETLSLPGLYVRDLDPSTNNANNSDLLLERCPIALSKELGISTDTRWSPQFTFSPQQDPDSFAFFKNPYTATINYADADDDELCYWSRPFYLSQDDIPVITYSIPLRDESGTLLGVMGIELSCDYLTRQLNYSELATENQGGYLLAVGQSESNRFDKVLMSGPTCLQQFGSRSQIDLAAAPISGNSYQIDAGSLQTGDKVFGCVQYLHLYDRNSPFEQDQWALIGVVPKTALLGFSSKLHATLLISLVLSLGIGVVGVWAVARKFSQPMVRLSGKVRQSTSPAALSLESIGIAEIDDLIRSIQQLSQNVAESSAKLAAIINLSGVSVGAFERADVQQGGQVFCSDQMLRFLGIDISEPYRYIDADDFDALMTQLQTDLEKTEEDGSCIYHRKDGSGHEQWLRLKAVDDGGRILGVLIDVTQEIVEKNKIEYERDYDLLTNLLNRRAFHTTLQQLGQEPEKLQVAALIMLDLDNLKYINDTYGHDQGDGYIRCMAEILRGHSGDGIVTARMSGDEFYVFLYGFASKDALRVSISCIQNDIRQAVFPLPDNPEFKVRASAGVAWYPDDSRDLEMLIKYADFAMYQVKNTIKGEFREFDIVSYNRDSYLLHAKEELNLLLENQLVSYHFQPIVSTADGSVLGYEALMRSHSKTLHTPQEILTIARSQSKLHLVEQMTWFGVLASVRRRQEDFSGCRIFLNSIPNQALTTAEMQRLQALYSDLLPNIVLELTEEDKLDQELTRQKQQFIQQQNAQLAIDDFGNGYNSESLLLDLTPDYVKIDMSIIHNIDRDYSRQHLLQSLVDFCHKQNIRVIAEGVETRQEVCTLVSQGVDYLQGFYLGRPTSLPQPVSAEAVTAIKGCHQL